MLIKKLIITCFHFRSLCIPHLNYLFTFKNKYLLSHVHNILISCKDQVSRFSFTQIHIQKLIVKFCKIFIRHICKCIFIEQTQHLIQSLKLSDNLVLQNVLSTRIL